MPLIGGLAGPVRGSVTPRRVGCNILTSGRRPRSPSAPAAFSRQRRQLDLVVTNDAGDSHPASGTPEAEVNDVTPAWVPSLAPWHTSGGL